MVRHSPVAFVLAGLLVALSAVTSEAGDNDTPTLRSLSLYASGVESGCEILSVQHGTMRAVVSNRTIGAVDVLDLSIPIKPRRLTRHYLGLGKGEELTSVAFHPSQDCFLAIVRAGGFQRGRVEIREAGDGKLLCTLPAGHEPDDIAVDSEGRFAVVANEGESYRYDRSTRRFESAPGGVTILYLASDPGETRALELSLADLTGRPGFVEARHKRCLEREMDLNGNGRVDDGAIDLDGVFSDTPVVLGMHDDEKVLVTESDGEVCMIPQTKNSPRNLEPEFVAFSPDGSRAYVILQENSGVAVIDADRAEIVAYYGLGLTTHSADTEDDERFHFRPDFLSLREPDGIALTPDGRYFVTADEGDTEPKASKCAQGLPAGGGRTLSVFDARTGARIGDTGSSLDLSAIKSGCYPDSRSDNKGTEPENLVVFDLDGTPCAAVGLERADAVALVSLRDPHSPRVVSLAVYDKASGPASPEGLEHLDVGGEHYVLAANEENGTVAVFHVERPAHSQAPASLERSGRSTLPR